MFGLNWKSESSRNDTMRDILLSPERHTQDKFWLQSRANWLVFLYCDLQLNHLRAIDDCDLVWWGYTRNPHSLWKNDLGKLSHPVMFEPLDKLKTVNHSRVKGQIVRMRTDRLIKLDQERQNKVQFLRKRVPIIIPSIMTKRDHKNHGGVYDLSKMDYAVPCEDVVWAWTYVANPEFWLDEVISISKIKTTIMPTEIGDFEVKTSYDYLMSKHCKTQTIQTVKRYSPNDAKEPYYYYAPSEFNAS